jgi:hypothetical protein
MSSDFVNRDGAAPASAALLAHSWNAFVTAIA